MNLIVKLCIIDLDNNWLLVKQEQNSSFIVSQLK